MYIEEDHLSPTELIEAGATLRQGIHEGVPMDDYLAGAGFPKPCISASDLVNLDTECAAYARAYWRCNPDRVAHEDTAATALGSAFHTLLLEGSEAFKARYAVKPADLNLATRDGKAWKAENEGREIIGWDAYQQITEMAGAVLKGPARNVLTARKVAEATMVAKDPVTGLWLIARPDLLISNRLVVNLKSARNPRPDEFERQVFTLRYYLGDAFSRLVAQIVGIEDPAHGFLVVGKDAPFLSYLATLKPDVRDYADRVVRALINQWADCVASDEWPSYTDRTIEIGLPAWASRKMQEAA